MSTQRNRVVQWVGLTAVVVTSVYLALFDGSGADFDSRAANDPVVPVDANDVTTPPSAASIEPVELSREAVAAEHEEERASESREGDSILCDITIVDHEGNPVPDVEVSVEVSSRGVGFSQVTNRDGIVTLLKEATPVVIRVRSTTRFGSRHEISLAADSCTVTLPQGVAITGIVDVDGTVPKIPIQAMLTFEDRDPDPGGSEVRGNGINTFSKTRSLHAEVVNGKFAFTGLPQGFVGTLTVRSDFAELVTASVSPDQPVMAPYPDTRFSFRSRFRVVGKIRDLLWKHENYLDVMVKFVDAANDSTSIGGTVNHRGEFAAAAPNGTPARVEVSIHETWLNHSATIVRAGPFDDELDLGEIELREMRIIRFKAIDESGRPLAGVVACSSVNPAKCSKPTNRDGSGELALLESISVEERQATLCAFVPGYDMGRAPIPMENRVPLEVVMRPVSSVTVTYTPDDGRWPEGLLVSIDAGNDPPRFEQLVWNANRRVRWCDAHVRIELPASGVDWRLSAIDWIPNDLNGTWRELGATIVSLAPGEHRNISIARNPRLRLVEVAEAQGTGPDLRRFLPTTLFLSVDGEQYPVSRHHDSRYRAAGLPAGRVEGTAIVGEHRIPFALEADSTRLELRIP